MDRREFLRKTLGGMLGGLVAGVAVATAKPHVRTYVPPQDPSFYSPWREACREAERKAFYGVGKAGEALSLADAAEALQPIPKDFGYWWEGMWYANSSDMLSRRNGVPAHMRPFGHVSLPDPMGRVRGPNYSNGAAEIVRRVGRETIQRCAG